MSEEPTENLSRRNTFEERVLAALADINNRLSGVENRLTALEAKVDRLEAKVDRLEAKVDRLETRVESLEGRVTALEDKVDARLQETRPIWEMVLSRLEVIDSKLDVLGLDVLEMRGEVNLLKKRQPPAA